MTTGATRRAAGSRRLRGDGTARRPRCAHWRHASRPGAAPPAAAAAAACLCVCNNNNLNCCVLLKVQRGGRRGPTADWLAGWLISHSLSPLSETTNPYQTKNKQTNKKKILLIHHPPLSTTTIHCIHSNYLYNNVACVRVFEVVFSFSPPAAVPTAAALKHLRGI